MRTVLARYPAYRCGSGGRAKGVDLSGHREPFERRRLDLADALPRDPEPSADLLQRLRLLRPQAVAQSQYRLLPLGQLLERLVQRGLGQADLDLLLDAALGDADEVADRRVVVLAERLVEARHRACRLAHLLQVLQRDLRGLRDLLVGRRPAQLRHQLALRPSDLLLAVGDVHGDADRARLVRDAALDGLPDPPGGVG